MPAALLLSIGTLLCRYRYARPTRAYSVEPAHNHAVENRTDNHLPSWPHQWSHYIQYSFYPLLRKQFFYRWHLVSACLMTYRPLLERMGRTMFMRGPKMVIGPRSGAPNKPSGDIPLTSWSKSNNGGFYRLTSDVRIDPRILVTTNINVYNENGASKEEV